MFCEDIEGIIRSFDSVEDCCLAEVTNGEKHEIICVVSGENLDKNKILRRIRSMVPLGIRIDRIELCEKTKFPYTHTLKADRRLIRNRYSR